MDPIEHLYDVADVVTWTGTVDDYRITGVRLGHKTNRPLYEMVGVETGTEVVRYVDEFDERTDVVVLSAPSAAAAIEETATTETVGNDPGPVVAVAGVPVEGFLAGRDDAT